MRKILHITAHQTKVEAYIIDLTRWYTNEGRHFDDFTMITLDFENNECDYNPPSYQRATTTRYDDGYVFNHNGTNLKNICYIDFSPVGLTDDSLHESTKFRFACKVYFIPFYYLFTFTFCIIIVHKK